MIKDAGYKLHHAYRGDKRGGGVAIIYKRDLTVKEGDASSSRYLSFEYAFVMLTLQSKRRMVLVCVYRNQEISFSFFQEELSTFVEGIVFKGDAVVIVGDFNVWVDVEDNADARKLLTLMSSCGLNQLVQEPTHRSGHTLDHIYVNEFQIHIKHQVINDTLGLTTDHFPIIIEIPSAKGQQRIKTIRYRKLQDIEFNSFRKDLQESYQLLSSENKNFETYFTEYHNVSSTVMNNHAPVLTKSVKTSTAPWIDAEYKLNRATRRKYEREWKRRKTEESRRNYVNQKNLCVELAISKQASYYSQLVQKSGNCQRSLFKVANELLDKTKDKVLPYYSDPKKLADEFNHFYVEKVTKIRNSIPKSTEAEDSSGYSRLFTGERMNEFRLVTVEDVKQIVKQSGIKTSMEDPIPSQVLQQSLDVSLPVLTELINKSLVEGSMKGVKESVIDPLLKKEGLDTDGKKNYRPVNNLLFFSKLVERVVDKQLNEHMSQNNLHENSQFAYKQHHNTETMMLGVTDEVLRGFDENLATIVIFLDLSAAFDTIDVDKFLKIMNEEIGVGGTVLKWFRSFLSGRTQRVKIENVYSDSLRVPCGAPQGSVLGPRVYNINTRSQPMVFKHCMFTSSSFADDSNGRKQFALTFQFHVINNDLSDCLRHIIDWNNAHFMKINPDKTEIMLLRPSSLNKDVIINGFIFEGQCIRFSSEVKNVGVWIDKNLIMDKHINYIASHCYKILKDIGRIKKHLQKSHLERLVHAVIASRLDYCNSLFVNISKDNIYKLQKVQNAAAKIILGWRRRDSASSALKELHWLNVDARITFKILLLVFKVLKGKCSKNLELKYKGFNGRPDDYLMLQTPNFKTVYGTRLFEYNGSRLWNALPAATRAEEDIEKYKGTLKTILFDGNTDLKLRAFRYKS